MKSRSLAVFALVAAMAPICKATWSIVIVDTRTKEVAIGSATCLTGYDLLALTPVMRVGVGGAAVQSAGDFGGTRRPIIRREFLNESTPKEILEVLSRIGGHDQRQYGIADTAGRAVTFSGASNGAHASGITGRRGTIVWAVQGNVLTGRPVVRQAQRALIRTKGDIAEKLMAAMEAARAMGGDGRCSCRNNDPDGCGSPPPDFKKSAHIGYMILARLGDVDSDVCDRTGCAQGDYLMKFNVPFQSNDAPDPVYQLRDMFNDWRAELLDQPDGVKSTTMIAPEGDHFVLTIELRNWQNTPITSGVLGLSVTHASDSADASDIGEVNDLGNGRYSVSLTPNERTGVDRFVVAVNVGERPVTLSPYPELRDSCGLRVDATRAKVNDNFKLKIAAHVVNEYGAPAPGQNVLAKVTQLNADPLEVSLGLTDEQGRARRKFNFTAGTYHGVVKAILPPEPGGQCLDPTLPDQRLRSRRVSVQ
ncbi:MAG: DUF1028 domain-containing protein [Phycisphaerales bacterium]|nr:DUF1028 domain-containing protein [Phycisphaerales bacterium]